MLFPWLLLSLADHAGIGLQKFIGVARTAAALLGWFDISVEIGTDPVHFTWNDAQFARFGEQAKRDELAKQRADLVAYIKDFSPRFREEKPEAPLPIPPEPPDAQESVARGRQIYQRMECFKCHGQMGRGDGPSSPTLTDSKERPIPPYDFTTGDRFKCGTTNQDLYRIFMTGLDGTPMPAYRDDLKPDEAWDLVHYLRTLQEALRK